jgi:peptidoglycan/LPS O-acetylase OafA/YrhL
LDSDVTASQSGSSFRPDVEGLRGVAVLLVVGCHCGISWCAGGFVGVDVFFVLSGYLITGLLAAECRATARIDLLRFLARRARRLLPASALVLVATTLFAATIFGPRELESTGRAAVAAGLYVSNLFFAHNAADYFALDVEGNPLLHTWSLGLEEQFYLFWPLLILAGFRGRAYGAVRSIWILGTVIALSLAFCISATRTAPTVAFYELPARAWEFAAGGILSLLTFSRIPGAARWSPVCGLLGIAAILGTALLLKGGAGFPGWIALVPVAGTLATLGAGAGAPRSGIGVVLNTAPLQFVGSRSYSWYLWHWPFVVFAQAIFPEISVGGKIVAALLALLAATLTFSFLERPVRENGYLSGRPGFSLRLGGGATVLTVGISWALMSFADNRLMDRTFEAIHAGETSVADLSLATCVSQGDSVRPVTCDFGAAEAGRTIVLFGDSHAIQWFNPLRTAAKLESWHLVTMLKSGCPAADFNAHPVTADSEACDEWRRRAVAQIATLQPTSVVMASYTGATIRGYHEEARISPEVIRRGTRRVLEALARASVPVVVLRDSPLPPFDVPHCIVRHMSQQARGVDPCEFDASTALNEAAFSAERAAAEGLPNISFLDLSDLFCRENFCPSSQNGMLVYRDNNHVTGLFAETLAPAVRARLGKLLRSDP